MAKWKEIELMNARTSSEPYLYVLNTTSNGPKGSKTEVIIDLRLEHGQVKTLVVPTTWIPVNLGEEYDPKMILNNPDFARQVVRGNLKILDSGEVTKFFAEKDPVVEEELRRLRMSAYQIVQKSENPEESTASLESKVSPMVIDIVKRTDQEMSTLAKLAALRNISGTLSKEDVLYISQTIEAPEISKFLKEVKIENNIR